MSDRRITLKWIIEESQSDVVEWMEDNDAPITDDVLDSLVGENIPTMTSALFALVVEDDNSLAFVDVETDTDTTPFNVLFEAVRIHVREAVQKALTN